jgi:hypothetical protein
VISLLHYLEPTISIISPTALAMTKTLRNVKTFKKSWDSDKALKSTHKGLFGKYQLRAYLFVALGYGIIAAWLTEMPAFACKYFPIEESHLNIIFSITTEIY